MHGGMATGDGGAAASVTGLDATLNELITPVKQQLQDAKEPPRQQQSDQTRTQTGQGVGAQNATAGGGMLELKCHACKGVCVHAHNIVHERVWCMYSVHACVGFDYLLCYILHSCPPRAFPRGGCRKKRAALMAPCRWVGGTSE